MPAMWRRIALWFLESDPGRTILGIVGALLIGAPAFYFGVSWIFVFTAACVGFIAGWASARRRWRKDGFVPKL